MANNFVPGAHLTLINTGVSRLDVTYQEVEFSPFPGETDVITFVTRKQEFADADRVRFRGSPPHDLKKKQKS